MKTLSFPDARKMPKKYINSLVLPQIKCWWSEPHSEYKICNWKGCWKIFSIEKIHGKNEVSDIHDSQADNYCCNECGNNTSFIYEPEEFSKLICDYISSKVSIVLLTSEEDDIVWFWVKTKTTVTNVCEHEFATRPWSYDNEKLAYTLSSNIFDDPNATDEELVLFHHIYVAPEVRNVRNSFKLLSDLFKQNPEYSNLPVIWETRYDGNFYPISRSIWFQNIIDDKYWYVVQSIDSHNKVSSFLERHEEGYRGFLKQMRKYKDEALKTIEKYPHFSGAKYYL